MRSYLLKQSVVYTWQHPIFGVGLGQFSNFEGKSSLAEGKIGIWHETHNAFTQVSSECGIPASIFFVLGICSALFSVNRIYRRARREGDTEIANASFCYLLSMVGFSGQYFVSCQRIPVLFTCNDRPGNCLVRRRGAGDVGDPSGRAFENDRLERPDSGSSAHGPALARRTARHGKMRILYVHTTIVPPPTDLRMDRFYLLSSLLEGEVLQPIWFQTPQDVEAMFGPGSYPVHTVGKFRYHWFLDSPKRGLRHRLATFRFYLR